jgi:membrane protease YdiL (CAAX protease family)
MVTEERPRLEGETIPEKGSPVSRGHAPGIGAAVAALGVGLGVAALSVAIGSYLIGGSIATLMLFVELGLLAGVVLYLSATRRPIAAALRLRSVPSRLYVVAIQLGLALLLANFAATALLGPPVYDFELSAGSEGLWERVIFAFSVVLVAPIVEESLFRGLLQGALEPRLRVWFAIILAAVPFALLHGLVPAIFFLFWSLPVGWVAWRTGSVRPGIVVHAINNLVGVVGLLVAGQLDSEPLESNGELGWVAVPLLLLAAMWSVRLCQRVGMLVDDVETGIVSDA